MTKTKNIRKFVKVIKPGTAKYRGVPYLHWSEEKRGEEISGTTQKTHLFIFCLAYAIFIIFYIDTWLF